MKIIEYNNPAIGCYFDGAAGQTHNDLRVLKLAISYGWEDKAALALVEADELTEENLEFLSDTVRDAEDFLNELETRSFLFWCWDDGNFGLWPYVEGAKEDVGFVSKQGPCECCDPENPDYPNADYRGEWLHVSDHGNCTLYVRGEDGKDTEIWSVV